MSEGRLFLLAHIRQEHSYGDLETRYSDIHLSKFEHHYLQELIYYNKNVFGCEWNTIEHQFLVLLYKKMKYFFQVKENYHYNMYDLIHKYEEYITEQAPIHGVIEIIDYA